MQYTKKYNSIVNLLNSLANNQREKNKLIYKLCYCVKSNFNFIDYIKKSEICLKLLSNYVFTTINDFRDNIVEKISDDFVKYVIDKGFPCTNKEQKDIKNSIIGLIGELFNIFYLEKLSNYTDPITGERKLFKCVLPYNVVMQQKDMGCDLICLNQKDEICGVQVKFFSTWSMKQGHKLELKEHCAMLLLEMEDNFDVPLSYFNQGEHAFITILGDRKEDVSIPLQNSKYSNRFTIIDKNEYFKSLSGNTTVFKDFYNFLLSI